MYSYFAHSKVITIIIVFLLAQLLGSALAVGVVELFPSLSEYPDAGFEILRGGPSLLLIVWFLYDFQRKGYSFIHDFRSMRKHIEFKDFLSILLFNILIGLFSVYVIIFAVVHLLPTDQLESISKSNGLTGVNTLVGSTIGAFVAVFLAPLAEEFIFRGFLFTKFRAKFSLWVSMIFSSLLFGAIHFSFSSITTFLFGLTLCIVFYKTKNLAIPIVLHVCNNAIVSIISISSMLFPASSMKDMTLENISEQFYKIALPCLVVAIALAYFLIEKRRFLGLDQPFMVQHSK